MLVFRIMNILTKRIRKRGEEAFLMLEQLLVLGILGFEIRLLPDLDRPREEEKGDGL